MSLSQPDPYQEVTSILKVNLRQKSHRNIREKLRSYNFSSMIVSQFQNLRIVYFSRSSKKWSKNGYSSQNNRIFSASGSYTFSDDGILWVWPFSATYPPYRRSYFDFPRSRRYLEFLDIKNSNERSKSIAVDCLTHYP